MMQDEGDCIKEWGERLNQLYKAGLFEDAL